MHNHHPPAARPARRADFDFLRVTAILAVIVIHCIAPVIENYPTDNTTLLAGVIVDSFMRWCVPVFVMLSGALLIKESAFTNMGDFFRRRFNRILIPILAWPLLYFLWWDVAMGHHATWKAFVYGYLSGTPVAGFHLYFLFLIAGLYVLTPFISLYASAVSRRRFWITTLILLGATTAWFTLEQFIPGHKLSYNLFTQGLPYVGYFMLGYLLKDIRSPRLLPIAAVFLAGSAAIALLTYTVRFPHNPFFFYAYLGPMVMLVSPTAFIAGRALYASVADSLSKAKRNSLDRIIRHLSLVSFGVYLIHIMILQSVMRLLALDPHSLKDALLLLPITLVLSWLAAVALLRIPKVRLLLG